MLEEYETLQFESDLLTNLLTYFCINIVLYFTYNTFITAHRIVKNDDIERKYKCL